MNARSAIWGTCLEVQIMYCGMGMHNIFVCSFFSVLSRYSSI